MDTVGCMALPGIRVGLALVLALTLAGALVQYLRFAHDYEYLWGLAPLFDPLREANVPTASVEIMIEPVRALDHRTNDHLTTPLPGSKAAPTTTHKAVPLRGGADSWDRFARTSATSERSSAGSHHERPGLGYRLDVGIPR